MRHEFALQLTAVMIAQMFLRHGALTVLCHPLRLAMSTIDTRREQMFPKLTPEEVDRLRCFGEVRRYAAGEPLFIAGQEAPGMFVIISGKVLVSRRDPLGHREPIGVEEGPGEFLAEVGQLSGQRALVDAHAVTDVEALLIPPDKLKTLLSSRPISATTLRALILRRIALIRWDRVVPF